MKKILVIHAHPERNSFCSRLKDETISYFSKQQAEVKVSDLYGMNFNPVGNRHDFLEAENPSYFKYQAEQVSAWKNDSFEPLLKAEMEKLEWCDTLIFHFPIWWFGLPAILKGWADRVLAMGFAYGAGKGVYENGAFKGKTAFLCFTTGGPAVAYGDTGKNGNLDTILYPIHHGIFYFLGMTVLPPFISFAPARLTDEERAQELIRYRSYLSDAASQIPLFEPGV